VKPVLGAPELRRACLAALEALRARSDEIDAANVYPVPDGDTGTNLVLTMEAVAEALGGVSDGARAVARAIAEGSLKGARGNSGVILSQVLRGLSEAVTDGGLDARALAKGLARGAELAYEAVLHPVEGTMLTVARAAADAALACEEDDCERVLDAAARAAREAVDRTPELLPVLRRAGVVDAGGLGLAVVLDAVAAAVAGRPLPVPQRTLRPAVRRREAGSPTYAYEVQYLLEGADDGVAEELGRRLGAIGDSVAVVGGGGVHNVHVHTNQVGRAIEIGMAFGRPRDITVVAFEDQVAGRRGPARILAQPEGAVTVVAVVAGEGLRRLFAQLGAGILVDGGRTVNPSVGELADALARAPTDDVILLPGSADALPAAREAVRLVPGKRVEIVPTPDLAASFAAMVAFPDAERLEDNLREMREALARTRTGRVAVAVRDAATPAGPVRAGQLVGFAEGEPVAVGGDAVAVAREVARRLGPGEVLTVLAGAEAPADEAEALRRALREALPGTAVEVHEGGQPVNRYLLALE
jgi:DAK2 domain fusion protein YloV